MYLQADSAGLPGAVLERIDIAPVDTIPVLHEAISTVHPRLHAGTPYWLTVVADGPGVLAGWSWNSVGDVSTATNFAGTQGGTSAGPWGLNANVPRGAFQVSGSPVVPVVVDVKPGRETSCLNPDAHGKTVVAIHGNGAVDVTDIEPSTLELGGAAAIGCEAGATRGAGRSSRGLICRFQTSEVAWEESGGIRLRRRHAHGVARGRHPHRGQ